MFAWSSWHESVIFQENFFACEISEMNLRWQYYAQYDNSLSCPFCAQWQFFVLSFLCPHTTHSQNVMFRIKWCVSVGTLLAAPQPSLPQEIVDTMYSLELTLSTSNYVQFGTNYTLPREPVVEKQTLYVQLLLTIPASVYWSVDFNLILPSVNLSLCM